jgi:large subunit ribosomal protein L1
LEENARTVIDAIAKARPASVRGKYMINCAISTTMSPSVKIDLKGLTT